MSEQLVNEHFNDFPIDYFKIEKEDFVLAYGASTENPNISDIQYQNQLSRIRKNIIEPDENGRIFNSLNLVLNLDENDTTVINSSVGQGKTYSILKTVETYFNQHSDAYIFIAVPFVSLVAQYYDQIIEMGISEDNIYRYEWLDPSHPNSNIDAQIARRIHIVTVNCLLGNAGENAVINSYIKRQYLQNFSRFLKGDEYIYNGTPISTYQISRLSSEDRLDKTKLEVIEGKNKKKSIFIYDEIHDAIHNFKTDNIFNLWHWKDSIHKNIIISATYNDASIVVIDYLSKLTNNRIHIIDSTKKIIRENQSELYLHFNANKNYKSNDAIIMSIVEDSLERSKNIDILCYSKLLAEDIVKDNDGVKSILERYIEPDDINLCVSELYENQREVRSMSATKKFNKFKTNIGTTFKTGVNIEKENHSYIIILPPESTKMPFKNYYGIFSGGINDLIQSLARQRIKGEIHIVLPVPERMDYDSLQGMSNEQKRYFIEAYNSVSVPSNLDDEEATSNSSNGFSDSVVKYKLLNTQSKIIEDKYQEFIGSILLPVISLTNNGTLNFPDLASFRILKGTKTINNDKFLGADLSAFITYCAFTNQFINCRLVGYNIAIVYFDSDSIERDLENKYDDILASFSLDNEFVLFKIYYSLLNHIYEGKKVYLDSKKVNKGNYKVKKAILKILIKRENPDYFSEDLPYLEVFGNEFNHLNYLMLVLQEIYQSKRINDNRTFSDAIKNLYKLREKIKETLLPNRQSLYLKPIEENDVFEELEIDAKQLLIELAEQYPLFLESKTFSELMKKSNDDIKKSLYSYLSSTIGRFNKSRKYLFSDFKVRKLESNIFDVPYS